MKGKRFTHFETLIQRLVEDTFYRVFGEWSLSRKVAAALTQAVENGAQGAQKEVSAHYKIILCRADYERIRTHWHDLGPRLVRFIVEVAEQADLSLSGTPTVDLSVDEMAQSGAVRVEAAPLSSSASTTQTYRPAFNDVRERLLALDAFLIVNGRRHVPLDKPLITIGRRVDNDVIIDSPVVSRQHAHVRWRHGRFILYDVGSRGGVTVNGDPCQECVLQPGDLITLANRISIIYGEGLENRESLPASTMNQEQETLTFPADEERQ